MNMQFANRQFIEWFNAQSEEVRNAVEAAYEEAKNDPDYKRGQKLGVRNGNYFLMRRAVQFATENHGYGA